MSNLLWEFKKPLEEAIYYPMCRDLADIKFCEHEVKAEECNERSSISETIMSEGDVSRIFMNIGNMIMINKKLLDKLEKGLCNLMDTIPMKAICVSHLVKVYHDIFVPIAPYFKVSRAKVRQFWPALIRIF